MVVDVLFLVLGRGRGVRQNL